MKNMLKVLSFVLVVGIPHVYSMNRQKLTGALSLCGVGGMAYMMKDTYSSYHEFLNNEMKATNENIYEKSQSLRMHCEDVSLLSRVEVIEHEGDLDLGIDNEPFIKKTPIGYKGEKRLVRDENDYSLASSIVYFVRELPYQPCECTITSLETEPEERKNGFASKILKFVEKEAKQSGCRSLSLTSVPGKEAFYKKRGFREVDAATGSMEKNLKESELV